MAVVMKMSLENILNFIFDYLIDCATSRLFQLIQLEQKRRTTWEPKWFWCGIPVKKGNEKLPIMCSCSPPKP